ncbi:MULTISPECIES: hybrid sensor histidine kinase/response regulator [unclassified Moorena]|uniref:hybrid sensor histidine kinase/response regulator n=1 Tax=unclassified Moorena TaxID=2683338 RepID=UPI001400760C|nr:MULTISPECIES: hybrid sensor histidine kinase/response regulator [unclassified Moorena]NEO11967.1 hybrid sensor histidine kinase/response regulator [Moorena sp. SIO3E8]NEP99016.1 hybrid sensor histidine kinase/response regulator [Moorena sp. SIO3F7]
MTDSGQDMSNFSMLDLFRMEVESQAAILNDKLLALESNPSSSQELESLMRAAHSIKGAARIVQIDAAVNIAHTMEDCFVAAMNKTITLKAAHIDVLLQGVDFLQQISQVGEMNLEQWLSEHGQAIEHQSIAIAKILAPESAPSSPQQPSPSAAPSTSGSQNSEKLSAIDDPSEVSTLDSTNTAIETQDQTVDQQTVNQQNRDQVVTHQAQTDSPPQVPSQESDHSTIEIESQPLKQAVSHNPQPEVAAKDNQSSSSPGNDLTKPPLIALDSAKKPEAKERVVRVSAENLNSLMGLAGESLVEANWLQPFADSLMTLKKHQMELSKILEKLQDSLAISQVNQVGDEYLKVARQKEQECREILGDRMSELELYARRTANLSDRLYREVIASHMRPFADGVQSFPRMIRDIARKLNKQVKLEIIGKSTAVDRDILQKLEAPLTHILRNSVDHGIEPPQERVAMGKAAQGTVRLEALHRGGMLSITVADDGKGIDPEKLRKKIVRQKMITPDIASQLAEHELMEFLFLPGFSTAKQVTEISGRGVGLDIAKTMAQQVGGTLRATSKLGQGTSFHFQLPLTLSVIRTLLVDIYGEPYAFPLARIDKIVMVDKTEISVVEKRQYFTLNDENIGLVAAHQVLELDDSYITSKTLPVVIISDQSNRFGLVVDKFLGERDLVVRPLDPRLGKVQDISAAALMGDGSPILILDVSDLVRSIDNLLNSRQLSQVSGDTDDTDIQQPKRILVVDDSITVRQMERKLLENQGYEVEVAVNGMDGWNAVRTNPYDLVISDIDMPRMNGIELVSHIKSHDKLKSIPVIIISYKDREQDRLQGLEAGADYYLTKSSFHDDSLLNAVIDLIGE